MALDTTTNLKTAIGNWLHRSDLSAYYDDWIELAEGMMKRKPKPPTSSTIGGIRAEMQTATGTLTAGDKDLGLPTDYLDAVSLTISVDGVDQVINYVGNREIDRKKISGSGVPAFYTIKDTIEFNVNPDSNYTYTLEYYGTPSSLTTTSTNYILDDYPELYLSGVMYHANRFVQNDQEAQVWLLQYKNTAWGASSTYKRGREQQGAISIKAS